jgi:hypothetical protein
LVNNPLVLAAARVKREIDEELRFPIEQRTAENIAAGMAPEAAAGEARKRFGNWQNVREARGANFGEGTWQNIRFGLRMLTKNWRTTVIVLLTLAVCIGANSTVFTIVHSVLLNDRPCEVIGVMPEGFSVAYNRAQLWAPKIFTAFEKSERARTNFAFQAIGRLKNGVSLAQARQELQALHERLLAAHPEHRAVTEPLGTSYAAMPIAAWASSRASGSMLLSIQAAAVLVLLIGCLNIAGVMVVQGHGRLREMAMRHALGATRWRLARQLITEGVMLFLIGGALGSWVTWTSMSAVQRSAILTQSVPMEIAVFFAIVAVLLAAIGL